MKHKVVLAMAVACCIAVRADAGQKEHPLDGVAAIVNEHIITIGDVMSAVESLKGRLTAKPGSAAYLEETKKLYLDAMDAIAEKFLILDSEEAKKVKIPDWYVDRRVEEVIKESFQGDRTRFTDVLSRDRQTFVQWREELRDHILISSVRQMKIEKSVSVSPVEVEEYYRKDKDRFVVPGTVRISMIVLNRGSGLDDPLVLARMLKERVAGGEDFAALAGKYSTGTYADKGGDWGWIDPSILKPELKERVDAMKTGEVEIVDGGEEIYVFRIEGRKDAHAKDYSEVQPLVERALRRKKADEEARTWIALLKKEAYVVINDPDAE